MASMLTPYVNLVDGRAREAVEFYASVLGGTPQVTTFGESGMEGPFADQVMHARLDTPAGFVLMVAPWGDEFGMLTDKFGIHWMVNIAGTSD